MSMSAISSITKVPNLFFFLFFLSHFFTCHGDDAASICPYELTAYESCVGGTDATECLDCVAWYWPATITYCTDLYSLTCTGLISCSAWCSECEEEFFAVVQCISGCYVFGWSDCPNYDADDEYFGSPTTSAPYSPVPAPVAYVPASTAPTGGNDDYDDGDNGPASKCPDETAAYASCVRDTTGCGDCLAVHWSTFSIITDCSHIDDELLCTSLSSCSPWCSGCEAQVFALVQCTSGCDFSFDWSDCSDHEDDDDFGMTRTPNSSAAPTSSSPSTMPSPSPSLSTTSTDAPTLLSNSSSSTPILSSLAPTNEVAPSNTAEPAPTAPTTFDPPNENGNNNSSNSNNLNTDDEDENGDASSGSLRSVRIFVFVPSVATTATSLTIFIITILGVVVVLSSR